MCTCTPTYPHMAFTEVTGLSPPTREDWSPHTPQGLLPNLLDHSDGRQKASWCGYNLCLQPPQCPAPSSTLHGFLARETYSELEGRQGTRRSWVAGGRQAAMWVNSESSQELTQMPGVSEPLFLRPSLTKRTWAFSWRSGTCCALGTIFALGTLVCLLAWS